MQQQLLLSYAAALPLILGLYWFSAEILCFAGGAAYLSSQGIFQGLLIYLCLLPLDRLLGVALDSAQMPRANSQKVGIMLALNLIGDLLVIAVQGPLWALVGVSILNCLVGIL
ncbi:MAG: hypothetical protein OHK0053_21950 [Microscillaceae bacterium]